MTGPPVRSRCNDHHRLGPLRMNLTDKQFDAFLAKLPKVRTAKTEEEREAIFAFRYFVFIEQLGSKVSNPDHRDRLHDAEDDEPSTTLLYTADEKGITGTARIRGWEPGDVPAKDFEKFSMGRFKGIERLRVGEMARLMLRADQRTGLTLVALSYAVLDIGSKTHRHPDLVFGNCHTGLARHYDQIGWRRYAGHMIPSPNGLTVPLVMVVSDVEHFRAIGSFLAPLGERAALEPLDTAPFAELFDERNLPVQFDKVLVRAAVDRGVATNVGFLSEISSQAFEALVEKGFVIRVPSGELLTESGLGQRELFIIIDGEFESFNDGRSVRHMGPGQVVGEVAFFRSDGRRTASVRCIQDGRVLVLRRQVVNELRASVPAVAADILFHLARTLADRTGRAHLARAPGGADLTVGAGAVHTND